MRSSQTKLLWIVLAVCIVLLLGIAVAVPAAYLWLHRPQPTALVAWQDPVAAIAPEGIAPEIALFPLAGALESETIDTAINNGELETAYATLAFGLSLSDAQRIGRLVLLGQAFAQAEQTERAALAYRQIEDLAVLSPALTDAARAEALFSAGQGWAALDQAGEARWAYDQVYTIARHSPYLQSAQRRDLFASLVKAYGEIGAGEKAQDCQARIDELDRQAAEPPAAAPPKPPELPAGEEPISSPEVGALEEARRQAAFALLQAVPEEGEPPETAVSALADALRAEDAAKMALYRQELQATTQLSRRIDIYWHLIRWLTLKYQVAAQGFGLSLVPEWEAQRIEIQSSLSAAYEELLFAYEDLIAGLPDAALIDPAIYRVRRQEALAGRLGQYPNYPEQDLADKVREAVHDLIAAGFVEPLYVDAARDESGLRFFLNTAARYGTAGQE
ncbi:MAG TPA: hypothetical protein ENJ31_10425 [Anaerolineae bacterium]|nr:hypothetical protein [Anaerolineae bacterium]